MISVEQVYPLCLDRLTGRVHLGEARLEVIARPRAGVGQERAGIDLEVAAALAGHKTIKVTGEVYSDPAEDRKRAAMEKLRGIG